MLGCTVFLIFVVTIISGELLSVVVVHRHGDRNPLKETFPKDPYRDEAHWPEGLGQLTNKGIKRAFDLGTWLRNRYSSFLPPRYSPKIIRVNSTDVDRTLMSAQAVLAGLYTPTKEETWNENLPWRPIPIHTKPKHEDPVLAMKKPCPKYNKLFKTLLKSHHFKKIDHDHQQLYLKLTEETGHNVTSILQVETIQNIILTQKLSDKILPEWTTEVFQNITPLAVLRYQIDCYTPDLARLKVGLLYNEIVSHFRGEIHGQKRPKFLLFSGHDATVASILTPLGALKEEIPPYASAVIFELSEKDGKYFVDVFYKKNEEVIDVTAPKTYREFHKFVRKFQPIMLNETEWEKECVAGHKHRYRPCGDQESYVLV